MKNHLLSALAISLITNYFALNICKAQAPQGIPYQAIARNVSGAAIASTAVKVRFSIRDSIANGPVRYQETHSPTTSALGLFLVNVGMGSVVSGSFSGINWGKNAKFLQVELDPAGGNTYTELGTTQMMSVPYALSAASAVSWKPTGTSYGEVKLFNCDGQFQYSPCLPKLITEEISVITTTTASCGGNITADGGGVITARGVCWSTGQNPTITLNTKTNDGPGTGSFTSFITGLSPNTLYHVRAYATNSAGTAYGNQVNFTTPAVVLPTLTTIAPTEITTTSAISGGSINDDGGGAITARGVCWSTSQSPTIALITKTIDGTGTDNFASTLSGLSLGTTYYLRAYATNSAGTAYGNQISFSTVDFPTVTTIVASAISDISATSGGSINSDGGGAISGRGVCWSLSPNPTIALNTKTIDGTGSGNFTSNITGLELGTTYFVRAYATNIAGTAYGNQISFSTLDSLFVSGRKVTDIDGNVYQGIVLGAQEWMKNNLNVSRYRNGDPIHTNLTNPEWTNTTTGAYAYFNNDTAGYSTFGKLYNWYAVADPRGLCPAGWHIPSDADWTILEDYLGGSSVAGQKMRSTGTKESGTGFWSSPNFATNSSGFSGHPGLFRPGNGDYIPIGEGNWWSSTEINSSYALFISLSNWLGGNESRRSYNFKRLGFSVRCLKD